ncbi:hypothetical protein BH24CHL1_BH24CHL1_19050 [soil metagenome]
MNDRDFTRLDESIDQAIDDLNAEHAPGPPGHNDQELEELLDTVRILRRLREPALPDDAFADTLAGNLEHQLVLTEPSVDLITSNGRGTLIGPSILLIPRRLATLRLIAAAMIRTIGVGVLAGIFAGIVTGGIGGRIVMRISAMMYLRENPNASAITESSGRQVGTFTLGGSVELLIQGAFMGLAGGLAYIVVKRWLPGSSRIRGITFGLLLLVILGTMVIDSDNNDFQRFGPPALNLVMFASIFILFGALVAPAANRIESWLTLTDAQRGSGERGIPRKFARLMTNLTVYGSGALGLLLMFAIVASATLQVIISTVSMAAQITGTSPASGEIPGVKDLLFTYTVFVLAVVAPLASAAYSQAGKNLASHSSGPIARPLVLLYRRDVTTVVQALLALGLVIGVGFTLRAFILILTATG